jgi:hypothetical protein
MDYLDFIGNIRFRFIKPHTPIIPIRCCRYTQGLRIAFFLEVLNTRLAYREREIRSVLRRICGVPKMSTFAIGALINQAVSQMPENQAFVNVGVWHGFTLLSGMANNDHKRCIGVDNFTEFGRPREAFLERFNHHKGPEHFFHKMDYVDYFSEVHNEPIGFYIYDGNHNYDSQLVGLKVAEPFLSENSIILIDDANYDMVRESTKDYISDSSYEYEVVLDQNTFCNYHPTFWNGVIVLQRVK